MIKPLILVGLVAAPAAAALGIWAGENQTPPETVTAARQNAPLVSKPGRTAQAAARTFAKLEPPPPPPLAAAPAPPPVDPVPILRREVRTLQPGAGGDGKLVLTGGRQLKLGDKFVDGWRLTAVSTQTATLKKGKEERRIDFFAPDPAMTQSALAQQAEVPAAATQISFTNGVRAGQLPPALLAQLFGMMRQSGIGEAQIEQMRKTLSAGSVGQGQLMPIIMGMARSGRLQPQQLTRFIDSLARAGMITPEQAPSLKQNINQVAQSRQTEAIVQQLNRPGPPRGNFPAPGGNRGGRGGPQGVATPRPLPAPPVGAGQRGYSPPVRGQ